MLAGTKSGNLDDILTEKIHQQRKLLNLKLGIDVGGAAKLDTTHIFSDYDLIVSNTAEINAPKISSTDGAMTSADAELSMSLKRKVEEENNGVKVEPCEETVVKSEEIVCSIKKKLKTSASFTVELSSNAVDEENSNSTLNHVKSLELFTQWLLNKLFDSDWEIRHGAATSLREIIKGLVYSLMRHFEATSNGNFGQQQANENVFLNLNWFQDSLVKMLSVIALDRFADYVGDEAVAPVREVHINLAFEL